MRSRIPSIEAQFLGSGNLVASIPVSSVGNSSAGMRISFSEAWCVISGAVVLEVVRDIRNR